MTTEQTPRVAHLSVGPDVIDPWALETVVRALSAGATVTFTGIVRDHDGGRAVVSLEYEAHPDAETVLAELVGGWAARQAGVRAVAVSHRTGWLGLGDVAFTASVAAAHRREAFEACEALVEAVKENLPVWKRQHFTDGSTEWVNAL